MNVAVVAINTLAGKPIIIRDTGKAILINAQNESEIWIPKSQVWFMSTTANLHLVMPIWLAKKNGLQFSAQSEDAITTAMNDGIASQYFN